VDLRRLHLLVELSRLGSMRAVADTHGLTTSTVSQQVAALGRELQTSLVEPDGRRVRLTPAGRRLADHAVTVLAALEAARLDLDPGAAPVGSLRVAAFATAVRRSLLPVVRVLAEQHPAVRLSIHEHEPAEALALLAADEVDLALTYDYTLAPATFDAALVAEPLWRTPWSLGVPARSPRPQGDASTVLARFADADWIVNSRNTADEVVVRTLASLAELTPRITHRADSLDLVQDMIRAGLGVGLLPAGEPTVRGVSLRRLVRPDVVLRSYAVVRRGRRDWPPLALVLRLLCAPAPARSAVRPGRTPEQPPRPSG
jgi:DNA-binding transcriptional LysR family regulator